MVKTALISVSDKACVTEFAIGLSELGFEILSTGGTGNVLKKAGVLVTPVSGRTGFPEILDGRVKTLHPAIHGGLLADTDNPDHLEQIRELGITPISILCVNLYPFRETVKSGAEENNIIENIDIGGPTLIRSSAKNFQSVTVVIDPGDYEEVLRQLRETGETTLELRRELARKAFAHTASYDIAISGYFNRSMDILHPEKLLLEFKHKQALRYGENPHQKAAFYSEPNPEPASLPNLVQHQGKALSYNNIMDTDAAVAMVREFELPAAVIVKHANPCGIGRDETSLMRAFKRAHSTDAQSAFGGIIALNRKVDAELAEHMAKNFVEVIVAPGFTEDALAVFGKKKNLRILSLPLDAPPTPFSQMKRVRGGILIQESDTITETPAEWKIATACTPDTETMRALEFAWTVVKHVKSNAVVFCQPDETVAIGAGQMSRVDSVKIAVEKAVKELRGSVLASDAFFPFRDSVDAAASYGVKAIVQPGGSIRDKEVIEAANEHGIPMLFTGIRHFRH
ncbi:MAG: bifunctional phosphoribosylaminoimidazolecarboxamide formyltransferase/inosine monophosphate cyclohydrolase [Acidobacteria bacterium CG_4_9_14_3_um_filter_49_7]|nr:MAG: bifunctional phosphoribosylaminoimidazolecarboxamide formyltransferase/inosine monophosphate cyclohydrolase [Acidobacteria bacterium CG_4_9_14_3_um_filter_49_7]